MEQTEEHIQKTLERYQEQAFSILSIPLDAYEQFADPFTVSEAMLFVLQEHAKRYAMGKTDGAVGGIGDVPRELQNEYYSQVAIAGPLFTEKALAALDAGDPALAYRLLEDAELVTPEPQRYIEPFFYSLLLGLILGEGDEFLSKSAEKILKAEPYIAHRIDTFLSRVNPAYWESVEPILRSLLPKP